MAIIRTPKAVYRVEFNDTFLDFYIKQQAIDFVSTMLNADGDIWCMVRKVSSETKEEVKQDD